MPLRYLYFPEPRGVNAVAPAGFRKAALGAFARVAPAPVLKAAGRVVYGHLG